MTGRRAPTGGDRQNRDRGDLQGENDERWSVALGSHVKAKYAMNGT